MWGYSFDEGKGIFMRHFFGSASGSMSMSFPTSMSMTMSQYESKHVDVKLDVDVNGKGSTNITAFSVYAFFSGYSIRD